MACYSATAGWYSQALHCYFLLVSPWPSPGDPRLAGSGAYHRPGDGAYYLTHCWGGAPTQPNVGYVWRAERPPGYGWALSPDVLAARAVRMLRLGGPAIALSPPLPQRQIVGLPMWAWTAVTPSTWGTHAATAAAGGESVTATAVSELDLLVVGGRHRHHLRRAGHAVDLRLRRGRRLPDLRPHLHP